ncbi:hypothetical protein GH714_040266 [Hevea brasiliensis]|uniref:TPX2 central domain-containing protein n=1 Tax=Hevea brasiliensis TaxID=3981 RepID=A0A6A6MPF7_HEVBR|nr:hypothetical protein GH714_040266 [Hevea brasiliensis]
MDIARVDIDARPGPNDPRLDKLEREAVLGISARFGDEAEGDGGFEDGFAERCRLRKNIPKATRREKRGSKHETKIRIGGKERQDMDFDMDEFFIEPFFAQEIDIDYEFDAAKYYDFTLPENDFEAQEAERWFETTGYYPSSPLIVKLNWQPNVPLPSENSSSICRAAENTNPTHADLSTRSESYSEAKSSNKSPLLKNSNFKNPAASQLAKQNCPPQIHGDRLIRRSQKLVKVEENSSRSSSMTATQATKRLKLEAGYSCKAKFINLVICKFPCQLLFLLQVGVIDVHTTFAKPKVTIPRQPNLETACRAERHRSKINLESAITAKSNACNFRARPLNRKILEAPSFPLPKKSTPQLPDFQVFHLRTSERAVQHAYVIAANAPNYGPIPQNETISSTRVTPVAALKEKLEALDKFKAHCLNKKECNSPNDKRFPNEPPIEEFNKLSLTSAVESNVKSQSIVPQHPKGSKENAPGSPLPGHEVRWFVPIYAQCVAIRFTWALSSSKQ